jgi:hypothetical protein
MGAGRNVRLGDSTHLAGPLAALFGADCADERMSESRAGKMPTTSVRRRSPNGAPHSAMAVSHLDVTHGAAKIKHHVYGASVMCSGCRDRRDQLARAMLRA